MGDSKIRFNVRCHTCDGWGQVRLTGDEQVARDARVKHKEDSGKWHKVSIYDRLVGEYLEVV